MKYLGCILIFISTLNILGDEDLINEKEVVLVQCMTFEQQEEIER